MADEKLVTEITKFAFLMRLASLVLLLISPSSNTLGWETAGAVAFIVLSSALGLYLNAKVTLKVAAHPFLVVIDVAAASIVAWVVGPESPILFYSLSTALLIGLLLSKRFAVPLVMILMASYLLAVQEWDLRVTFLTWIAMPAMYVVLAALGHITRQLHNSALDDQRIAHDLNEVAAGERERARLARDMHDSVAKSLHGIGLAAAALPAWMSRDTTIATEKAGELQHAAETASREARQVLLRLRSDGDDRPLAELLREKIEQAQKLGLHATLEISGIADCDQSIKDQIVLIVGEGLENVSRHAEADKVQVTCEGSADRIRITVTDDGRGFDQTTDNPGHFGLTGMHERAALVDGSLLIRSSPGKGTSLHLSVSRVLKGATS